MSLGVAALLMNTACYTYVERPTGDLKSGEDVVIKVNDTGRAAIAPILGDSIASAEGNFVANDVAGFHVKVTDVQFQSGISSPRDSVPVTLGRAMFDSVTARKFSVASTAWVVLGIAAGVFALAKSVNLNQSGSGPQNGKTPPPSGN